MSNINNSFEKARNMRNSKPLYSIDELKSLAAAKSATSTTAQNIRPAFAHIRTIASVLGAAAIIAGYMLVSNWNENTPPAQTEKSVAKRSIQQNETKNQPIEAIEKSENITIFHNNNALRTSSEKISLADQDTEGYDEAIVVNYKPDRLIFDSDIFLELENLTEFGFKYVRVSFDKKEIWASNDSAFELSSPDAKLGVKLNKNQLYDLTREIAKKYSNYNLPAINPAKPITSRIEFECAIDSALEQNSDNRTSILLYKELMSILTDYTDGINRITIHPEELARFGINFNGSQISFEKMSNVQELGKCEDIRIETCPNALIRAGYDISALPLKIRKTIKIDLVSHNYKINVKFPHVNQNLIESNSLSPFPKCIAPVAFDYQGVWFRKFFPLALTNESYNEKNRSANEENWIAPKNMIENIPSTDPIDMLYHIPISVARIMKLIPVTVDFNDGRAKDEDAIQSITFWFLPTEEFMAALPERYSERLRQELDAICMYEHNEPGWEEACKGISSEPSFYDICRMKSGAIEKISISPNPASDKAEISILMLESKPLKISLHDESGRPVKILSDFVYMKQGENTISVDLSDIPSGVYLISATSDNSEQAVRRIAIAR